jgi:UDP-N-acetylmuramoyl-tripeptide--D-alanyl-D-alanine ligase
MRLICPILGAHNAVNLLLAAAAAAELGVPTGKIAERAATFAPVPHRLRPIPTPFGTLLDDTYNANPASTEAALRVLEEYGPEGARRIFVFGDMLDLEAVSEREHTRIAKLTEGLGIDVVFPVGDASTRACRAVDLPDVRFVERHALAHGILGAAGGDAVVLIKGSRGLGLEAVAAELVRIAG